MVSNPMAKKARNSFLLGIMIMLIISLIVAFAFYFLVYRKGTIGVSKDEKICYVYRLKQNVKYGEEITSAMVESVSVSEKVAPAGSYDSKTQTDKGLQEKGFPSGVKAKVDLKEGTILGSTLTYTEEISNDLRIMEYNMLTLPTTLSTGDYVDVRLALGNGGDFLVISKKRIENIIGNTITFKLSEDEILLMNSAIVEAYVIKAANLYVNQYVDTVLQDKLTTTYTPSSNVTFLINNDVNILKEAKDALSKAGRLKDESEMRKIIDNEISNGSAENAETKMKEQIQNAKKAREAYLNGLTTY